MNIYGTILFLILAGGAGIFAILALTNTVEIMQVAVSYTHLRAHETR